MTGQWTPVLTRRCISAVKFTAVQVFHSPQDPNTLHLLFPLAGSCPRTAQRRGRLLTYWILASSLIEYKNISMRPVNLKLPVFYHPSSQSWRSLSPFSSLLRSLSESMVMIASIGVLINGKPQRQPTPEGHVPDWTRISRGSFSLSVTDLPLTAWPTMGFYLGMEAISPLLWFSMQSMVPTWIYDAADTVFELS